MSPSSQRSNMFSLPRNKKISCRDRRWNKISSVCCFKIWIWRGLDMTTLWIMLLWGILLDSLRTKRHYGWSELLPLQLGPGSGTVQQPWSCWDGENTEGWNTASSDPLKNPKTIVDPTKVKWNFSVRRKKPGDRVQKQPELRLKLILKKKKWL